MAVSSTVTFAQGVTVGPPGQALFGVVGALVTVSNGSNANVARWKFEVLDVPPGSAVPVGVVQDGGLSTYSFTPDVRGGYLVRLTVFSAGDVDRSEDARCFGVPEVSGRFIPPFTPRTELGDAVLNFGGQARGWAKYVEDWFHFVDTISTNSAGIDAKDSVRLATTGNIALSGLVAIDGVATVAGNRVLVKNQTAAQDNGIYNAAAGAWTRSTDADTSAEVTAGMFCWVTEGATQQDTGWIQTNIDPITLGVTPLSFAQFSGLGQVVAGAGLTKTGNTLDVVGNPDGSIVVNPNDVQVGVLASDAQHGARGGDGLHALVVASGAAGFMSGADKALLDGLGAGSVPSSRAITAGAGLTGGGDLTADRTIDAVANADGSIVVNPNDIQVGVLATDAQHGLRGGGTQHDLVVAAGAAGFMSGADKTKLDGLPTSAAPTTRALTAGAGLTGGGDLTADRTFDVVANADGSIVVNANDVQVGVLATDGQHGVRGGGTQHAAVVAAGANGFMTGADKSKLDGISASAAALTASAPADVTRAVAVVGVATTAARADHKHDVSTAAPVNVVTANAEGVATSLARSDHAHNLPFSTVQSVLAAATGNISVNAEKITDVAAPTAPTDAANKAYVDAISTGLHPKASCVAVSTSAIVLSGTQTIDGVAVVVGNRVLVAGQGGAPPATHINNGIYVVAAGAWSRAADMAAASTANGSLGFVESGTTYGGTSWVCTNDAGSDVVGTNALGFTLFAAAASIVAGDGLTKTGNTLDVVANADGSIVVNANDVRVGVLASDVQHGVRGGGTQHALVVSAGAAGFMSGADKTKLDGLPSSAVPTTRTLTAGNGLTGGGDLTADRTFNVLANADGSIIANADDVQVGVLATDAQHGARGGGTQHALAVAAGAAGFLSGSDKSKLDGISTGAAALTSSAPADVTKSAAVVGVAATAARADHKHDVTTGVPIDIDDSDNDEGVATTLARSDHMHNHGARGGGSLHALATTDTHGFMSSLDKSKLDSIATGAAALTSSGPSDVTGGALVVGVATTAARADHVHHLPFSAVQTVLNAATGNVGVNSQRIVNVADPTADTDAATKAYVDAIPWKRVCRVASTANITLSGTQTIDGVAVVAGDRVLVTGQTTASANGLYVVAAGAWARAGDADTSAKVKGGLRVWVDQGTTNSDTDWELSTNDPIVLGTTALTFLKLTSSANAFKQSLFTEIAADTTTTSTTFVDVVSFGITLGAGGILIIHFTASASNAVNNDQVFFRILIDGVAQRGAGLTSSGAGNASVVAITLRKTGLTAALHTIKVQWRVNAGTGQVRPATAPDSEHLSLLLEEVTL